MRAVGSKLQAAEQQALMVKNGLNKEATMAVLLSRVKPTTANVAQSPAASPSSRPVQCWNIVDTRVSIVLFT
jgi:hypothetical protein